MSFYSINPYTQEQVAVYEQILDSHLDTMLQTARKVQILWSQDFKLDQRCQLIARLADLLLSNKDSLALLISLEMGKVKKEALAEIEKCASLCSYYVANAQEFLSPQKLASPHGNAQLSYLPLGTILGIMPWNFPFWQVFRYAIPNLLLGNTVLLKHAPNVFGCACAIQDLMEAAGLPSGAFQSLLIDTDQTARVIADPRVAGVTLTGSERAGRAVAAIAGKHLKKTVMELGGSDPFIVLKDADLELAAKTAVKARMLNAGQSCIAAKRFIIEEGVYDSFSDLFCATLSSYRLGDPLDGDTQYGPMARPDLAKDLQGQLDKSISLGARILHKGGLVDEGTSLFQATVIEKVPENSPAFNEELFGPVASLFSVKDAQEAIRIANSSAYGLGASIWTADPGKAEMIAEKLASGCVYVNQMVFSHPAIPFGGVKLSGYGRELSKIGMLEFANAQTLWHG